MPDARAAHRRHACSARATWCRSPSASAWCVSSTIACSSSSSSEIAAAPALQASVNVSPASTTDPDWWAGLDSLLRTHAGVAERLIVEITESAAIHDIDETRGFVARVKDLGCRIAIDDFGAGYTSFRNLRKLGVDIVKIDGAFVQNLIRSEDDRAFVRTLIDLAKRLGLATVAEWVQDERHRQDAGSLGLRLSAGRACRPRLARAAVARQQGAGGVSRQSCRHGRTCSGHQRL